MPHSLALLEARKAPRSTLGRRFQQDQPLGHSDIRTFGTLSGTANLPPPARCNSIEVGRADRDRDIAVNFHFLEKLECARARFVCMFVEIESQVVK